MPRKHLITIREEKKDESGLQIFDISFARRLAGIVVFSAFDLGAFNQRGYLVRLVNNFKEAQKTCYILFSSFRGIHGSSVENIDRVLAMTDSYLALEPIIPEKWSEKITASYPNLIYCLALKEDIQRIQDIFNYIDSIDTWCNFIFDDAAKREVFFTQIKKLHKNRTLNEEGIHLLGLEAIGLRVGKYSAEDFFRIYTRRFDLGEIRKLLLNSVDTDKFEVKLR